MHKGKAEKLFENASAEVGELWEPYKFSDLDATEFLESYCWVVFTSGFQNAVVQKHFAAITAVFKDFGLDALAEMAEVDVDVLPIKNERKASGFLQGAKAIASEGFDDFKERVREGRQDVLEGLPGIGPKTRKHLAMAIGLDDTAKDDVWLVRCADACSTTVEQLVSYLSEKYGRTKQQVDAVLWQYCEEFQKIPPTA